MSRGDRRERADMMLHEVAILMQNRKIFEHVHGVNGERLLDVIVEGGDETGLHSCLRERIRFGRVAPRAHVIETMPHGFCQAPMLGRPAVGKVVTEIKDVTPFVGRAVNLHAIRLTWRLKEGVRVNGIVRPDNRGVILSRDSQVVNDAVGLKVDAEALPP